MFHCSSLVKLILLSPYIFLNTSFTICFVSLNDAIREYQSEIWGQLLGASQTYDQLSDALIATCDISFKIVPAWYLLPEFPRSG